MIRFRFMEELDLFPKNLNAASDVMFVNFGEDEALQCMELAGKLRSDGFSAEVYPDCAKMQKQMKYANKRNVPFVVIIGDRELADNSFVVKDMSKGDQTTYEFSDIRGFLRDLKLFLN